MDDIFLFFRKKDHVKKLLKVINSFHQNIKFAFEEEHNNITLLDISKVGNELKASLF